MFIDDLIDAVKSKNNPAIVGLDPRLEYVPDFIKQPLLAEYGPKFRAAAQAIWLFNRILIDAVTDIVPAVKLQIAYYELYGVEGLAAFNKTVAYAKNKGLLVIADCKRNDIDSTAACYADAFLGETMVGDASLNAFPVDAITVNPYLGADGILPFNDACIKYDKGLFILVKTSNTSSGQFQDLFLQNGRKVYEAVAGYVAELGHIRVGRHGYSSIGAVAGATWPEDAFKLRQLMPEAYFLVPGYGYQGGDPESIRACFNRDGLGAVISASRSIMLAYRQPQWQRRYDETCFTDAARAAAIAMRDDIAEMLA